MDDSTQHTHKSPISGVLKAFNSQKCKYNNKASHLLLLTKLPIMIKCGQFLENSNSTVKVNVTNYLHTFSILVTSILLVYLSLTISC